MAARSVNKMLVIVLGVLVFLWLLQWKLRQKVDVVLVEPVFQRSLNRIQDSRINDEFCLVSYNILADLAIRKDPGRYQPLSQEQKLKGPNPKTSSRHMQLMKELEWLQPNIISLQEVDDFYFPTLVEELGAWDFQGVFKLHYEGSNGLATFYDIKKFKMEKTISYSFNELFGKFYNISKFENSNKYSERIAQFTLLRDLGTNSLLAVGNVHLMFGNWKMPDMHALQISLFLQQLHKFVVLSEGSDPIPWVISGDFNMYPYFPTYDLVSNGKVSEEGLKKLNPHNYKYPQVTKRDVVENKESYVLQNFRKYLSHPLKDIKSAYKTVLGSEPPLTHYQINKDFPELYGFKIMRGTLDYVWYSSDKLQVNAVLEPVKEEVIKALVACPNKFFPSDHLSMKACFSLKR